MGEKFILYTDGACRGNPGLGGWGVSICNAEHQEQHACYGGEAHTTNNRMELTAAIQGILACPADAEICIFTDSTYVQKGITEWIVGWRKKQWKDVKNPDLWQQLDTLCQQRQVEWQWIKGHAGHAGNERADQLANLGADQARSGSNQITHTSTQTPDAAELDDWLSQDPLGLANAEDGLDENHLESETTAENTENLSEESNVNATAEAEPSDDDAGDATAQKPKKTTKKKAKAKSVLTAEQVAAHIHITEPKLQLQGERILILDTETTGFYYNQDDRIIEVGAIEMINRKLTGSSIHIYINPLREVGESENIHGISDAFLADKPTFDQIAQVLQDYLRGAEIVAHNASFDMNFLDAEFERAGMQKLSALCSVTDTLALAKKKHPGQKNSLDALVKRYEIPERDRTFHGALLDSEILADVYLAMTGGQVSLDIEHTQVSTNHVEQHSQIIPQQVQRSLAILPNDDELAQHQAWLEKYQDSIFAKIAQENAPQNPDSRVS